MQRILIAPIVSFALFVAALQASPHVKMPGHATRLAGDPDCVGVPPNCMVTSECHNRGGVCATGGEHGKNGYYDFDGKGCGCQL